MHPTSHLHTIAVLVSVAVLAGCPMPGPQTPGDPNASPRYFQSYLRYPAGTAPFKSAVEDLNGDGRNDLVIANRGSDDVSVLIRQDGETYAEQVRYAAGDAPSDVAMRELTGDAFLDVIVLCAGDSTVYVFPGIGDGTLAAPIIAGVVGGSVPEALAIAELTGDAFPDLATADSAAGTVSVLAGSGDGSFGPPAVLAAGSGTRSVIARDLNRDGAADIVAANRNDGTLTYLQGVGDGSFVPQPDIAVGATPREVDVAELNGDQWLDLVVSAPGSLEIDVLIGLGGGAFAAPQRIDLAFAPTRIALEDFDRDNNPDIAAILFEESGQSTGLVQVYYGDGLGGFGRMRAFGVGAGAVDVVPALTDGDAFLDLVVAATDANDVRVLYGNGAGGFESDERLPLGGRRPREVLAVRLDSGPTLDLVIANLDTQNISVLLGDGDGGFGLPLVTSIGGVPRAIAAGFLDTDSNLDLVVTNLLQAQVSVLLGRGDGTFRSEDRYGLSERDGAGNVREVAITPRSVALADISGDGVLDIATGNADSDSVSVLIGNGDGTFQPSRVSRVRDFPLGLQLADVSGDGTPDAIMTGGGNPLDPTNPQLVVIPGSPDGRFDAEERDTFQTGPLPSGLLVADLDSDGDRDVATVHETVDAVYVHEAIGSGRLSAGTPESAGTTPNTVVAAPVTPDARPDLITVNDTNTVSVLVNEGSLSFAAPRSYPVGDLPNGAAIADLNGDGNLDLITVNRGTDDISILFGRDP